MKSLRVAGIVKESIVDGPGLRFVIFSQGCPHNCQGCHNLATHDYFGGKEIQVDKILDMIDSNPILQGVTFSGGEPFVQVEVFNYLATQINKRGLDILAYSGFTFEQLIKRSENEIELRELLQKIDILIDGKFVEELKDLTLKFRGSSNQRIIDLKETIKNHNKIILKKI